MADKIKHFAKNLNQKQFQKQSGSLFQTNLEQILNFVLFYFPLVSAYSEKFIICLVKVVKILNFLRHVGENYITTFRKSIMVHLSKIVLFNSNI